MKWFKHYTNCESDYFIQKLIEKFGFEGYGRWWKLLELIASQMTERNNMEPRLVISKRKLAQDLAMIRSKLDLYLEFIRSWSKVGVFEDGEDLILHCPKLLEIKDNHSKNLQVTCKRLVSNLPLDKDKDKEKEKEINIPVIAAPSQVISEVIQKDPAEQDALLVIKVFSGFDFLDPKQKDQIISKLLPTTQETIFNLYNSDKEFFKIQFGKMSIWLDSNKRKNPKSRSGWANFVSSWLSKNWEEYRKNIKTNEPYVSKYENVKLNQQLPESNEVPW